MTDVLNDAERNGMATMRQRKAAGRIVSGKGDQPTYWIFDPHNLEGTVATGSMTHIDQVDEIIRQIQDRVRCAAGTQSSQGACEAARYGAARGRSMR